jgi:hypothetical protein
MTDQELQAAGFEIVWNGALVPAWGGERGGGLSPHRGGASMAGTFREDNSRDADERIPSRVQAIERWRASRKVAKASPDVGLVNEKAAV